VKDDHVGIYFASGKELMTSDFKWRHSTGEIILWAVRWYCKYGISYREPEDMMEERGLHLDHTTVHRWVQHYAPQIEKRLRWGLAALNVDRSLARR
jgi:transposase-like protein